MADRALPTVLVVGASRGIGLELARAYAPQARVFGTVRDAQSPGELARVPDPLPLSELGLFDNAALWRAGGLRANSTPPIDLLVHSAGVNRGTYDEQRLINAEAPFAVISSLMPAVMRSSRPRIAVLTSDLGTSARDNWRRRQACGDRSACDDFVRECKFVPICAYSLTKLSANLKLRALEPTWRARGVTAVAMQPGHVRTDMNSGKGRISARGKELAARGLRRERPYSTGSIDVERASSSTGEGEIIIRCLRGERLRAFGS